MNDTYRVRRADTNDLLGILAFLAENEPHAAAIPLSTDPRSPTTTTQQRTWERVIDSANIDVYIAETAPGEPAGTALLAVLPHLTYDCRPSAVIEAVVVRHAHRRRGIATALLSRLLHDAKQSGCFKVQLLSHKRHADDGAHDLYYSLGFHAEAEGFVSISTNTIALTGRANLQSTHVPIACH